MAKKEHRKSQKVRRGGIVADHYRTLKNQGQLIWRHVVAQLVLPLAVALGVLFSGVRVGIISELIAGFTIFGGFLFGLVIYVFQLRRDVSKKSDRQRAVDLKTFIDQLFSNVLYAVLVSFTLVVLAIISAFFEPKDDAFNGLGLPTYLSAVLALVFVHLLGVIWMCLNRTRRAYLELRRIV